MPQLLNLSRAARLVGVSRGDLQKKIRSGELPTFEGKVRVSDVLRVYPETCLEDNTMLERVARIKAEASPKSAQEREGIGLPTPEVLLGRLTGLSRELVEARAHLGRYVEFNNGLLRRLETLLLHPAPALRDELEKLHAWVGQELARQARLPERKAQLLVQDTFLRIMAAHVKIIPSGHEFFVEGSKSILEAALGAGLSLNYGCTSGQCGSCKARVVSGEVWKIRPHDYALSESEKNLGYILMCAHTAVTDLVLEAGEAHGVADLPVQRIPARIKSLEPLGADLLALHVQTPRTQSLRFMAGQYAALELDGVGTGRYPLANCPCDGHNLQFHVPRAAGEAFSDALFGQAGPDRPITVSGPYGDCVLKEDCTSPLLMFAYAEGFAPIKSLVEHAVSIDMAESIHVYWLAPGADGHYLDNLGRSWADALDNFRYTPLTLDLSAARALEPLLGQVLRDHPRLADCEIYLAGPGPFTRPLAAALLAHGAAAAQVHVQRTAPGLEGNP